MKKFLAILLAAVLLAGCAASTSSTVTVPTERLKVYTCLDAEVYEPLLWEFAQRTGIFVETTAMTAPEMLARADECDVLLGAEAALVAASDASVASVARPEGSYDEAAPVSERYCTIALRSLVLIYNPKLIRQNPPTGLGSLLEEAWRGQLALADPESDDFSQVLLQLLLEVRGDDAPALLAQNVSSLLSDTQAVIDSVADGSCRLAAAPEDAVRRAVQDGASLTVVYPTEGTYRSALTVAVAEASENAGNAQKLVDFLCGEDAQRYMAEESGLDSVLTALSASPENEKPIPDTVDSGTLALWRAAWEGTQ